MSNPPPPPSDSQPPPTQPATQQPTTGDDPGPSLPPSTQPKRKRRSAAEVGADKLIQEQKQLAREKAKEEKAKDLLKAVRAERAKEKEAAKSTRFFWSEGATADLLECIGSLKQEHDVTTAESPGFISWTKYWKENTDQKEKYEMLKAIPHNTLERRYKALLNAYRSVRDSCAATGGEGFHHQLDKYNLSEQTYNTLGELHESNDALNCVGGANPTQLLDDNAGAPVSPGSVVDNGESGLEDADAGGPASHSSDDERGTRDPTPPDHLATSGTVPGQRHKGAHSRTPSSLTPARDQPPSQVGASGRSVRAKRARTTREAVEAAGRAKASVDSSMAAMLLYQKEAAERAEREAERDARREEREEQRDWEAAERRQDELIEREVRRQADQLRYERGEERRAEERQRDLERRAEERQRDQEQQAQEGQTAQLMNMMLMRVMGQNLPNNGPQPDGSNGSA